MSSGSKSTGKVKFFREDRGFGFIVPSDGKSEIFVHISELRKSRIDVLYENDLVEFSIGPGKKGQQATDLKVLKAAN